MDLSNNNNNNREAQVNPEKAQTSLDYFVCSTLTRSIQAKFIIFFQKPCSCALQFLSATYSSA